LIVAIGGVYDDVEKISTTHRALTQMEDQAEVPAEVPVA
jgi:hypothetical protein